MPGGERDQWFEVVAIELARRVGDRYVVSSWPDGVWERARAADFSPAEALELLLQHPPDTGQALRVPEGRARPA